MKKLIIIVLALLLAGVGVSLLFFRHTPFHYSGVIEAVQVDVPARLNDLITDIYIDDGSPVKEGEVIARLECKDANLQAAIAEKEFKRAAQLLKTTAGSRENYDLKKHQFDAAVLHQSWCEIKSPLTGKVLYKYYEPGEFIAAGRKLASVADFKNLDVWIYVPHDELARITIGGRVDGYLPETGQRFEGTVLSVNDQAEFTPKNVQTREERTRLVYGVKTRFVNDDKLTLKPGMTLEAEFPDAR